MKIEFDGHVYTPEDIQDLREDVIVYRDRAIEAMPAGAQMAVVLSHVIAVLSFVRDELNATKAG